MPFWARKYISPAAKNNFRASVILFRATDGSDFFFWEVVLILFFFIISFQESFLKRIANIRIVKVLSFIRSRHRNFFPFLFGDFRVERVAQKPKLRAQFSKLDKALKIPMNLDDRIVNDENFHVESLPLLNMQRESPCQLDESVSIHCEVQSPNCLRSGGYMDRQLQLISNYIVIAQYQQSLPPSTANFPG